MEMANITDEKVNELVAERSILFDLNNQFYSDLLRKDNVWYGKSLQSYKQVCRETHNEC